MNQKEAYEQGKANGYSAASYLDAEAIQIASEDLDYGDPDFLDKEELEEVAESAAWEGEQSARQYSGFAGFAAEINNGPESRFEGLWDKYEEGVIVGVKKGVREWLKGQTKSNPRKMRKRIPKKIEIWGKRWFQRSYGNTYHTVRIYLNDKLAYESPQTYGYGDHYSHGTAKDWLVENGYLPPGKPIWYLRDHNGVDLLDHVEDVKRERDL
jgi:hypothetical protein